MTTIRVTRPADFAGAAAAVLGFEPHDSLMLLPLTPGRPHARIDHPHTPEALLAVATEFGALYREYPGPLVLLAFTGNRTDALDAVTTLVAILDGICDVVQALQIDGDEVLNAVSGDVVDQITPDMRETLRAHLVSQGHRLPSASREARQRQILSPETPPAPENFEASTEILATATTDTAVMADEAQWTDETVRIHTLTGLRTDDADAARLIVNIATPAMADAALSRIDRDNAAAHVALWADLVRRSPEALRTAPALMLAFAAWQQGDGALGYMVLDHAAAPEDHPLARILTHVLGNAVRPTPWRAMTAVGA